MGACGSDCPAGRLASRPLSSCVTSASSLGRLEDEASAAPRQLVCGGRQGSLSEHQNKCLADVSWFQFKCKFPLL